MLLVLYIYIYLVDPIVVLFCLFVWIFFLLLLVFGFCSQCLRTSTSPETSPRAVQVPFQCQQSWRLCCFPKQLSRSLGLCSSKRELEHVIIVCSACLCRRSYIWLKEKRSTGVV